MKVAIVAGEASGDQLGASLVRALKQQCPHISVEGVGGPRMKAAGCNLLHSMDTLSVMGIVEPLKRLPAIFRLRKKLLHHFTQHPPDVFVSIDSPDFNLGLAHGLKRAGIKTVHYVSPTIWAWRANRIHKIKKAVDLMLCLFPFEPPIYKKHHVNAVFVGHPLADEIPLEVPIEPAREKLNIPLHAKVLTLMPGSRENELHYLAPPFIKTALACAKYFSDFHIVVPVTNEARRKQFLSLCGDYAKYFHVIDDSRLALQAADVVLTASGTATLEAMLFKKPMVVAYKMHAMTYFLAKRLVKTPFVAFPNLLMQKKCVPEFLQDDVNLDQLMTAVKTQFETDQHELIKNFTQLHQQLQCHAAQRAAEAILSC